MSFSSRPLLLVALVVGCSVAPREENMTSLGEGGSVTGHGGDGSSSESGGKLDVGGTISEIAEVFGQNAGKPYYQAGFRLSIVANRVELDATHGNRFGGGSDARWFAIGLRFLTGTILQ